MTPRVLQVVLSLNPGGTERLVIELARRLHAEMPMAVCCLDEAGAWAGELERSGIHMTALGRRAGFHPTLALKVAAAARAHRATVIHAHHYSPFVYSALARLVQPHLRVIFTEHGRLTDAGPSPKRRVANQVLSRFATRVFAVSENVRQHLIAEGFDEDEVGVIYNGIDVGPVPDAATRAAVRRELGVTDDTIVVATIGRLDTVKDLGTLLRALAASSSLSPKPLALSLVGAGPERAALEGLVARLGVRDRVRFLGQRDDARRWLAGADVYVNSSISEGVSLTILEAMAAGLPVVATAVGGTPEVVTAKGEWGAEDRRVQGTCDGPSSPNGLLVPPRDADALAAAIVRLGSDARLRQQLGEAGRARVEADFTLRRMVDEYAGAYRA